MASACHGCEDLHGLSSGYRQNIFTLLSYSGIGKIYLYDHLSDIPLIDEIREFTAEGFVEYTLFNGVGR